MGCGFGDCSSIDCKAASEVNSNGGGGRRLSFSAEAFSRWQKSFHTVFNVRSSNVDPKHAASCNSRLTRLGSFFICLFIKSTTFSVEDVSLMIVSSSHIHLSSPKLNSSRLCSKSMYIKCIKKNTLPQVFWNKISANP